ncbi:hypothetical protein, partial [Pseudomonas mandelii]|uniref:hypothetical protein n=1 Tax=Pseudomonas mandelii TaxID=75612 RepID=UPI00224B82B0
SLKQTFDAHSRRRAATARSLPTFSVAKNRIALGPADEVKRWLCRMAAQAMPAHEFADKDSGSLSTQQTFFDFPINANRPSELISHL